MRRYARTLAFIALLVLVAVLSLTFQTVGFGNFQRGGDTPLGLTLGLDLQGGIDLRYQAALKDAVTGEPLKPTLDQMRSLQKTIESRVNASGLGRPIIQILGDDRLLIQLSGVRDTARAKSLIGETARLEIKHRVFNVSRSIDKIAPEDILDVRVTTLEATTTPPAPAPAGEPATSTATTTPASVPMLEITFTESAAEEFARVVERLEESTHPILGTEQRSAETGQVVAGSGRVFLNFLELSVRGGTSSAVQLPYSPVAVLPDGTVFALRSEPYIRRVEGSTTYAISLIGAVEDVAEAEAMFGGVPELRLTETLGKLDEDIGLTGEDLARAYAGTHQTTGLPIVNLEFKAEGSRKFGEVTTRIAQTSEVTPFILDGVELMAPGAQRAILTGTAFVESPNFTIERVRDIALLLESGRLPIPIELIRERTVDAILGSDSLAKSVVAGLAGLALVLLFMVLYYRLPGVVAAAALMIYGTLLLAIFKLAPLTLELSGVAAAILSIGMAVDANILIFERMKEELRTGRTLLSAINIGFNRAWPAIRDSNVSTLITCAILFWFADTLDASIVKSFALTLAIGVAVSMFSAIMVSRTFLRVLTATPLNRRLGLFAPAGGADLPQRRLGVESA